MCCCAGTAVGAVVGGVVAAAGSTACVVGFPACAAASVPPAMAIGAGLGGAAGFGICTAINSVANEDQCL